MDTVNTLAGQMGQACAPSSRDGARYRYQGPKEEAEATFATHIVGHGSGYVRPHSPVKDD